MRLPTLLIVACLAVTSCTAADPVTDQAAEPAESISPSPSSSSGPEAGQEDAPLFPGPRAPVPNAPYKLAAAIRGTNKALPGIVDVWLEAGGPVPSPQPIPRTVPEEARDLVLGALWQQRLYAALTGHPKQDVVLRLLPKRMARVVGEHTSAGRGLRSLVTPLEPPLDFKVTPPHNPHRLLRIYKDAAKDHGIPWEYLASLNFVESKFGRFMGPSSAGAEGPMQFIPSTWDYYGNGGDVWDPRDAVRGAARYVVASGAPSNWRAALFAYNRSYEYVDAIITYARNMQRDPRNFYVYYFWQVYVLTTKGRVQISGPGAVRV